MKKTILLLLIIGLLLVSPIMADCDVTTTNDGVYNYTNITSGTGTSCGGNFTFPSGVTGYTVAVIAGGGAGGCTDGDVNDGGGGGGGQVLQTTHTNSGTISYYIGKGGNNHHGYGGDVNSATNGTFSLWGTLNATGGIRGQAGKPGIYQETTDGGASGSGQSGGYNGTPIGYCGGAGGGQVGPGANGNTGINCISALGGTGVILSSFNQTGNVSVGGRGGQFNTTNRPSQDSRKGSGGNGGHNGDYYGNHGNDGAIFLKYNLYPIPSCSFDATPLSGSEPLTVTFTDTSTNSPTSWTWLVYKEGQTYSSSAGLWSDSFEKGNWTVNHTASNGYGSCSLSKPNYISVFGLLEDSYVVVNLDVKDAQTGALIQDSAVGIKNTTSGVWRNSTSSTGLVYFDSTGLAYEYPLALNQSIVLAAGGTGYQSASTTFNIPYSNYRVYLYLVRTSVIPASGTGTVIINVISNKNGVSISGASVVLDTGQIGSTNTAGSVVFLNVTAGNRTVTVSTPTYAYQTTSKVFDLFSGETKFITIQLIMAGETPVPTFQPTTAATTPSDLNTAGTAFLERWAQMAIAFGGLIFLLVFLYFVKKVGK